MLEHLAGRQAVQGEEATPPGVQDTPGERGVKGQPQGEGFRVAGYGLRGTGGEAGSSDVPGAPSAPSDGRDHAGPHAKGRQSAAHAPYLALCLFGFRGLSAFPFGGHCAQ